MNSENTVFDKAFKSHFNLPFATVFYPTREEFADPWKYLNSIRTKVAQSGIGVIQPPSEDWDTESFKKQVNPAQFKFHTKAQNIHQMQHRDGPNVSFLLALRKFWKEQGSPLDALPEISGVVLDLYKLRNEVLARGGLEQIDLKQQWESIAQKLRIVAPDDPEEEISNVCSQLRSTYMNVLHRYVTKDQTTSSGELKRKAEDLPSEPAQKKQRVEAKDPLWMQVKSRSFTKDNESKCLTRFSGASKGKMMTAQEDTEPAGDDDPDSLRKNFGYHEGHQHTLESFEKMANRFEYLMSSNTSLTDMESKYWEIIEKGEEFIQVYYGSDLDVASHGSGFPTYDGVKTRRSSKVRNSNNTGKDSLDYMRKSGWNVNNLSGATFLHHLGEAVAGVTRPMMYVGMMFTNFCWHTEDNYLYSVNYVHTGKPKLWYGIPAHAAELFEKTMQTQLPDLFQRHPNLLHLLITQLSPRVLVEAGVPVFTAIQKAGQFIVTCPRAYHAGFNTGFNVAESVNFALEDWLPFCRTACTNYRYQRSPIFPFEEFVMKAATTPDSLEIAKILQEELKTIIQAERVLQRNVHKEGITKFISLASCEYQPCYDCGYDCYLSGVTCNNHPGTIMCLSHVKKVCDCNPSDKRLVVRVHLMQLKQLLDNLTQRIKDMETQQPQLPPNHSSPTTAIAIVTKKLDVMDVT